MERKMLINLKRTNYNHYNAFCVINKQLQVLYPHAYQSYIFNQSVSERLNKFGMNILIGDIVKKKKIGENCDHIEEVIDDVEEIDQQHDMDEEKEKETFVDNNDKDLDTSNQTVFNI
jgi:tRNA pseudouridine13 synthase